MVLVGLLSNPELTSLYQCLISRDWHKARRRKQGLAGWSDGRRKFGSVGQAIVQVLARADTELRVEDIHKSVEYLLGGPVSRSSVKNYLRRGCERRAPLFERVSHGRYRVGAPETDRRI